MKMDLFVCFRKRQQPRGFPKLATLKVHWDIPVKDFRRVMVKDGGESMQELFETLRQEASTDLELASFDNSLTRDSEERISVYRLHTNISDAISDLTIRRRKRTIISFGRWATNILLRGARLVRSNTYVQYYIKPGGYKTALDDFDSVKPVNSITKPHPLLSDVVMKTGRVVDKNVYVILGNIDRPPSIQIFHNNEFPENVGDNFRPKIMYYGDYADVMNYMIKCKIFE